MRKKDGAMNAAPSFFGVTNAVEKLMNSKHEHRE